jgi:MarR family transcriptional regulator, 2-MHQ and catechol-resistance regulon repressor
VRATDTVTARLGPLVSEAGLSMSQFGVLEALYHLGPLAQCELAKKLLKTGGNVTMVVDNLEKCELVKRERSQSDRRFVTVALTTKGRRLISRILPRQVAAIVEELSILSDTEQQELDRLCRKLGLKQE